MLPDRVSNPGPLTYESGALPIALRGPAFRKKECKLQANNLLFFFLQYITKSRSLTIFVKGTVV